ncbi:MAG: transcription-repair coupling factor [Planctomycetales bacterium]
MGARKRPNIRHIRDLVPLVAGQPGYAEIVAALQRGESATIDGAWGSACALVSASLVTQATQSLLIVLPRLSDVDEFAYDLAGFLGTDPVILPAWEARPRERLAYDPILGARLAVARKCRDAQPPDVIVTSLAGLLQPLPAQEVLDHATRTLQVGQSIDPEDLAEQLRAVGCERVTSVERPGEYAFHGGILDIFSIDSPHPLRIEFFGDDIESLRRFDAETQTRVEELKSAPLTFFREEDLAGLFDGKFDGRSFLDDFPSAAWIMLHDLAELEMEGKQYLHRLDDPRGFFSVQSAFARCTQHPTVSLSALPVSTWETTCHLRVESIERFKGHSLEAIKELASIVGLDESVLLACHNEGEQRRLTELLAETDLPSTGRIELCVGHVAHGFRLVEDRIIVLSDHELFGRRDVRQSQPRKRIESRAIDTFLELVEGDFVVHLNHGIARYRGMKLVEKGEQQEEHLILEFRDKVQLYVPVTLIHLVQKYVGGAKGVPQLSKVGSSSWEKKKQSVAQALVNLAGEMIQLQAEREMKPGIAFPPDSHWQTEFEASFPFQETEDQLRAISDIKGDMTRPRPMDRLICGDVGFGKTEVAIRAAFKAIDAGKQVAVLVPTTILAEQHYRTFTERMAEYPFRIEVLSRFRTKSQQKQILEDLKTGAVDLVIGTHRLVQSDVEFHELGAIIIDEEQRFGVEAKEKLKRLRLELDVLTLSATPIPRTLHLSLLGIRDISNLTTPPQDRQRVETRICRFDEALIRQGIMRELNRSGQVYFVHNKVYNIETIADRLQGIVPEARIGIAHGQMPEHELEEVMVAFVTGQLDILVATTIIESGLDIPQANTIFIHEADRYGLADLHQLRGRVGRDRHRAYCYLLLEEGKHLTVDAAKRMKAIEEFSELGAGFRIALRDLEIRGAGNILGNEQSGHIASVGYELYCQMLENAVRRLKKEPLRQMRHVAVDLPLVAHLPGSYVPPGRPKIDVYRKLSRVASLEDLESLSAELRDRFGPPPPETMTLLELKKLQVLAQTWQIDDIHLEGEFAVLGYRHPRKIKQLAETAGGRLRIVDQKSAYFVLNPEDTTSEGLLNSLKALLQTDAEPAYNPPPSV